MVRLPANIVRAYNGHNDVPRDFLVKAFMVEGYGKRAAEKWIRNFTDLDWIRDNKDGTLSIGVPYRYCRVVRATGGF